MEPKTLEVFEPPDGLQESRLLRKLLDRIRDVGANPKAVLHTAVQVDLVGRADVQQQSLKLGAQRRR